MARDRWDELCELVENDDGLPVRDVGEWTREKLYFWNTYIEITSKSKVGENYFKGLAYIDLFAGPGVCRLRKSGMRFPGSCLIAAHAPRPFHKLILCEENSELISALQTRIGQSPARTCSAFIEGDCNARIADIVKEIPPGYLSLAFVDPTGLHHRFETIAELTSGRRVDLLVLFADFYDIHRNQDRYAEQDFSNLDAVLGPDSDWRRRREELRTYDRSKGCKFFADLYESQLRKHLGYEHFGEQKVLRSENVPQYRLIFASKSSRGVDFWNKAVKKHVSGQGELF